jgi:hypothetical protein
MSLRLSISRPSEVLKDLLISPLARIEGTNVATVIKIAMNIDADTVRLDQWHAES